MKMATASSLMEVTNPTRRTTAAKKKVDLLELLHQRGMEGDADFLRAAPHVLVVGIMDAEVSAQIGAQHGERDPERVTRRNGYRNRAWDTRVGTMELRIPKIREGSYFPSLLEPGRRSEKALLSVVQQGYVEGVSTRRVDDLIKALGCDGISISRVSRICQDLDEVVGNCLSRPLDGGPYRCVWDALTQKVGEDGRIVKVSGKCRAWAWAPARTGPQAGLPAFAERSWSQRGPASTKFAELSSISFAGSPPVPGLVAGLHRCGSWARQTLG